MGRSVIVAEAIGTVALDAVTAALAEVLPEKTLDERREIAAVALLAAREYGGLPLRRSTWRLSPDFRAVLAPEGTHLTTAGLVRFYGVKGWDYMIFRVPQLLRGYLGDNARLQEMLGLYEATCRAEGVSPVPDWADGPGVAGGTGETSPFARMLRDCAR